MAGTVPVFGKGAHITIVNSHPATKKVNFTRKAVPWYKDVTKLSLPQIRACRSLGEFAYHKCYGKTGTVTLPDGRRISMPAYIVMTEYPHRHKEGVFGGKTREERAEERHRRARARLDYLKKLEEKLSKKPAAKPEVLAVLE